MIIYTDGSHTCGTIWALAFNQLTHWGVIHICVGNLTIIGSDNGLLPTRRLAIIWTNVEILLKGPLGTNSSEISIKIITFSFKKINLKVWSVKPQPFCLSLNVLTHWGPNYWSCLTMSHRSGNDDKLVNMSADNGCQDCLFNSLCRLIIKKTS